jgi:hypothetical protein
VALCSKLPRKTNASNDRTVLHKILVKRDVVVACQVIIFGYMTTHGAFFYVDITAETVPVSEASVAFRTFLRKHFPFLSVFLFVAAQSESVRFFGWFQRDLSNSKFKFRGT